jgi:hypothetical protein
MLGAAYYGNMGLTRCLLEAGASPLCTTDKGSTPYELAQLKDHPEVAEEIFRCLNNNIPQWCQAPAWSSESSALAINRCQYYVIDGPAHSFPCTLALQELHPRGAAHITAAGGDTEGIGDAAG